MSSASVLSRTVFGFSAWFLVILLNSPLLLSITQGLSFLLLALNVVALSGLSLGPHFMLFDRIIDLRECSKLFLAVGVGLIVGGPTLVGVSIASGSFVNPAYTSQFLLMAVLLPFLLGYNLTFWGLCGEMEERRSGKNFGPFVLLSPQDFRQRMLIVSVFSVAPIIGLLLLSQYLLVAVVAVVLVGMTITALKLQGIMLVQTK